MKLKWLDRALILAPYFTLATSDKILKQELKNRNVIDAHKVQLQPGAGATTTFLKNDIGEVTAIVCLFDHSNSIEQIHALLAHEAVHIWQEVQSQIREENPSKEFEAYSVQKISQELFYEYKRQRGLKDYCQQCFSIVKSNNKEVNMYGMKKPAKKVKKKAKKK